MIFLLLLRVLGTLSPTVFLIHFPVQCTYGRLVGVLWLVVWFGWLFVLDLDWICLWGWDYQSKFFN